MTARVLIVEDEKFLADAISTALSREDFRTHALYDGTSALSHLTSHAGNVDVVVLDRDLPGVHGDEICARIVADYPHIRVLMLTAAGTLDDRLSGFELGADDYLPKPFELPELIARVSALARRSSPQRNSVLVCGDVRVDVNRKRVMRGETEIRLSPKEFAVLQVLLEAGGAVISAEELLEEAWDANADPFTNSPRVTISYLRRKLGEPWIIHTRPGEGYFAADPAELSS
ncbi:response regulator transcription factor [Corynebacterium urinipleomorphum]|uniref:response regulator transcription factor n=1 Tax=Corynebacterium urinipleomorphum TaxID=1852380 RepID=UPI000B34E54A|nr:response regulator transcription factor [Corynebacterium urinipleomorphum]